MLAQQRRSILLGRIWTTLLLLQQGKQSSSDAFQQPYDNKQWKHVPWHRGLPPQPPPTAGRTLFYVPSDIRRRRRTHLDVISSQKPGTPPRILETAPTATFSSVLQEIVTPILLFVLQSFLLAVLWISWEDLNCSYTLPSRHRTALLSLPTPSTVLIPTNDDLSAHAIPWRSSTAASSWGTSTVHGLGFGEKERLALLGDLSVDELSERKSYNEVLQEHREQRVAAWKRQAMSTATSGASTDLSSTESGQLSDSIHILCESLKTVWYGQALAADYKWDDLRAILQSEPWTKMPLAASHLRFVTSHTSTSSIATNSPSGGTVSKSRWDVSNNANNFDDRMNHDEDVIGFDWGSCAWRHHCGALADAQESLDELDSLLGVLEPFEAIFCLDIVERSLRDMLAILPLSFQQQQEQISWIQESDLKFLQQEMPLYQPHPMLHNHAADDNDPESDQNSMIDDAYLKALQELRIEYD